jgi:4-hydroxy-tetrahydrodipicolinate synthase
MQPESIKKHLRDVAFTTPVPFTEDGEEVLYDEVTRTASFILDAGGTTFIPCGNTGEYHSLTDDERIGVVKRTVDTVGNDSAVIGGVGGSTKHAIELVRQYEDIGADGVMIHAPDHTYIHKKGIVNYFKQIAESTDLGVVLYKRSPNVSLSIISELLSIDNVIGLKFAMNDIELFSKTVRTVPDDFVVTNGIAERFAPSYALEGAEGFTTGIGSFVPELCLALQDAIEAEDWTRALEIRDLVRPYEEIRDEAGPDNNFESVYNVPAVKYGLELAGQYGGPVREPLVELPEDVKARARECYERMIDTELA